MDGGHKSALRLFNGFLEGCPELVVDLYGCTLVLQDYSEAPEEGRAMIQQAQAWLQSHLPWLQAGIVKVRNSPSAEAKRGRRLFGEKPDRKVQEQGVWYALNLCMQQDASLYLDTRTLRTWARQNLSGKSVLNTFAYTGSLGVAALAGGAQRVVQLDLMDDTEARSLEDFFASGEGRLGSFLFTDPWDGHVYDNCSVAADELALVTAGEMRGSTKLTVVRNI